MTYAPPPEPQMWLLPRPVSSGGLDYDRITLRAPSGADVLKATALAGAAPLEIVMRLIAAASIEKVPFEVVLDQPEWIIGQMSAYFEEFAGNPAPDPLEAWRTARREAAAAANQAEVAADLAKAGMTAA